MKEKEIWINAYGAFALFALGLLLGVFISKYIFI